MEIVERILIFREKVNMFINRNNIIFRFVGKFILAMIVFQSLNQMFGYSSFLEQRSVAAAGSLICMFIPYTYSYVVFSAICVCHLIHVSADITLLFIGCTLFFYVIYNRNFKNFGYLTVMTAILLPTNLSALVPIFVGIFSGPLGIPPMLMGIIIYFFSTTLDRAILELNKSATSYRQLYQIVLDQMISNKEMILCLVCFVITALIAGQLYRLKVNYAWPTAIPAAGIIHALMYLYGGFLMEIEIPVADVIISFVISVIILELLQFFRCLIDYSRVENLQFEDDEYYYYVKAVPKIRMEEDDISIKKITEVRSLIRKREKKE